MINRSKQLSARPILPLLMLALFLQTGCGRDRSKIINTAAAKPATENPAKATETTSTAVTTEVDPAPLFLPTPNLPVYPNGIHAPLLSLGGAVYNGTLPTDYCVTWGDPLTAAQGLERLKWAKRCHPEWASLYTVAENVTNAAGQKVTLYPTFGRWNDDDKPYNPLKFVAPVNESSSCNVPEAYQVVILCAPTR